jgi:hypothetical protein
MVDATRKGKTGLRKQGRQKQWGRVNLVVIRGKKNETLKRKRRGGEETLQEKGENGEVKVKQKSADHGLGIKNYE